VNAQTGVTIQSTLDRLKGLPLAKFDIIVTALGLNDVTHAVPRPLWIRQQQRLFAQLDALFQPLLIYVLGVPPLGGFPILPQPLRWSLGRQAARFDANLAETLGALPHIRHVPFNVPLVPAQMAEDGFHPGPKIYALWAKEMASRITSDWPKLD
jgi:lysophospholipase L1-like esterase